MLGSVQGVHETVAALAKAYQLNMRPGCATVIEAQRNHMILSLEQVHYFLDSHHVGAFEGALKLAGVRGRVRIASHSRASAHLMLEWSAPQAIANEP
jgi:hypothetical protein